MAARMISIEQTLSLKARAHVGHDLQKDLPLLEPKGERKGDLDVISD